MVPASTPKAAPARAATSATRTAAPAGTPWTFLTNHAHVLFCLARDPESGLVADRHGGCAGNITWCRK